MTSGAGPLREGTPPRRSSLSSTYRPAVAGFAVPVFGSLPRRFPVSRDGPPGPVGRLVPILAGSPGGRDGPLPMVGVGVPPPWTGLLFVCADAPAARLATSATAVITS